VHWAQALGTVLFENLDMFDKAVTWRRSGYCFELNALYWGIVKYPFLSLPIEGVYLKQKITVYRFLKPW